ncbi:MAG: hypothetical protein JW862_08655, partial [Anaerolineales bacterium]|nr:hypothetical protein [Anaerolineales bacterium]
TLETTATQPAGIQLGAVLFKDTFDNTSLWSRELSQRGTISLAGKELSIVLVEPRAYLASVRSEPDLSNYYAEITASPSLCRGQDEYGLLFHYQSQVDFYRFSLSCNGQLRLDRLVGGTAASPQPWLPSAMVPSAAPSQTKLGVWVQGETMRFYLNGELQFEAQDAYLRHGRFGVFARSAGETAVTISFSDLQVYQIEP